MRPLEILLIGALAFILVRDLFSAHFQWRGKGLALILSSTALVLHLIAEGYRWQMVPVYLVAFVLVIAYLFNRRSTSSLPPSTRSFSSKIVSWFGVLVAGLFLFISFAAGSLFPVSKLPEPMGEYTVGHIQYEWVDTNRPELHTEKTDDFRKLIVYSWYPADQMEALDDHSRTSYWSHEKERSRELTRLLSASSGIQLPSFLFSHLDLIKTHSYQNFPLSRQENDFPIIIFSHGLFAGYAGQNTTLMEQLASHGYIVFSIEHAYWGLLSEFESGPAGISQNVLNNYRQRADNLDEATIAVLEQKIRNENLGSELGKNISAYLGNTPVQAIFYEEGYQLWSDDQIFVLDKVTQLSESSELFSGKLDLNRIGIMGMSFGGPTTFLTCSIDPRCKAGIDLDGFNYSAINLDSIESPFLYMRSSETRTSIANHQHFLKLKHDAPAYILDINNAEHFDFTDFPIIAPVFASIGQLGEIDPEKMVSLVNEYSLAFFDKHLKNQKGETLRELESYSEEVDFYKFNPESVSP